MKDGHGIHSINILRPILDMNNLKHFARHSSNEDTQLKLPPSEEVMKTSF